VLSFAWTEQNCLLLFVFFYIFDLYSELLIYDVSRQLLSRYEFLFFILFILFNIYLQCLFILTALRFCLVPAIPDFYFLDIVTLNIVNMTFLVHFLFLTVWKCNFCSTQTKRFLCNRLCGGYFGWTNQSCTVYSWVRFFGNCFFWANWNSKSNCKWIFGFRVLVGPTKNLQSNCECEFLFIILSSLTKTKNSEKNGKSPSKMENTEEMAKHWAKWQTLTEIPKWRREF
jgi:hypothetical protein